MPLPLILASSSPRRRLLMAEAGYDFTVVPPHESAECGVCSRETPPELVARLAFQKAGDVAKRTERGIVIGIRDEGVQWLLHKTLPDRSYGARPLRRAIQRHIEDALSEAFIRGQIRPQLPIDIGVEEGALWYWQDGRGGALSA